MAQYAIFLFSQIRYDDPFGYRENDERSWESIKLNMLNQELLHSTLHFGMTFAVKLFYNNLIKYISYLNNNNKTFSLENIVICRHGKLPNISGHFRFYLCNKINKNYRNIDLEFLFYFGCILESRPIWPYRVKDFWIHQFK